jgi:hypothetical protein
VTNSKSEPQGPPCTGKQIEKNQVIAKKKKKTKRSHQATLNSFTPPDQKKKPPPDQTKKPQMQETSHTTRPRTITPTSNPDGRNIVRMGSFVHQKRAEDLLTSCRLPVSMLQELEVCNVAPNGNCCLLVTQQYLYETGREARMSATEFRMMLHQDMLQFKTQIQSRDTNDLQKTMGGEAMFQEVLEKLYRKGVCYEKGCAWADWAAMCDLAPVLLLKYKIAIKVFQDRDIFPNMLYKIIDGNKIIQTHRADDISVPTAADNQHTLSCIFQGLHYYLIRPRKPIQE